MACHPLSSCHCLTVMESPSRSSHQPVGKAPPAPSLPRTPMSCHPMSCLLQGAIHPYCHAIHPHCHSIHPYCHAIHPYCHAIHPYCRVMNPYAAPPTRASWCMWRTASLCSSGVAARQDRLSRVPHAVHQTRPPTCHTPLHPTSDTDSHMPHMPASDIRHGPPWRHKRHVRASDTGGACVA